MKITCDVIEDLLPIYAENISSNDTQKFVEEHLISCDHCRNSLEKLKIPKDYFINTNTVPLKKLQKSLQKKKSLTIFFSVSLTMIILIIVLGYITVPQYIPYDKAAFSVTKATNTSFVLHIDKPGIQFEIEEVPIEGTTEYSHHISIWTSIFHRIMNKESTKDIIINPDGKKVYSVYFSPNDGSDDKLIYGVDQFSNGGMVVLPRLVLAAYFKLALLITIILSILFLLFRKKKRLKSILFTILSLPLSYIIGHLCVKGNSSLSYSVTRDFFAILLAMIPIYCILLFGYKLLSNHKQHKVLNSEL